MQAVKQPHKVTVSTYHRTRSSCALDLVVSMLEHEHAFFVREQSDRNYLLNSAICMTTSTERSPK